MPTRVLLLRHAETRNPLIFHGAESDVGLSERGERQAELIAEYLAAFRPETIVTSGMRRALATATPISRACAAALRVEPLLHERRIGVLSGTPTGDPQGPWAETTRKWAVGEVNYATEGAESYADIRERVVPVWQRVARELEGSTYVVVAHGVVIRVLLTSLLPGYAPTDYVKLGMVPNVALTEVVREGEEWRALRLFDVVVKA